MDLIDRAVVTLEWPRARQMIGAHFRPKWMDSVGATNMERNSPLTSHFAKHLML